MQELHVDTFDHTAHLVRESFATACNMDGQLYSTDVDLWPIYLASFDDPAERQYHNCNCCRQFIQRFGGLVTIDADGVAKPAMWNIDEARLPGDFRNAVVNMWNAVLSARITGVFKSSEAVWGTPKTGYWRHFAVSPLSTMVHNSRTETAGQLRAYYREAYGMLQRGLAEFSQATFDTAVAVLQTEALYRSNKFLSMAETLAKLKHELGVAHRDDRASLVWRAVATQPRGFAHVRSSMIGTLLEDLEAGLGFDEVKRRFDDKMHPLRYQRPQAAPKAGNIAQAEKLVATLGLEPALPRRYASVDEVIPRAAWTRGSAAAPTGGVFDSLKATAPRTAVPGPTVTWRKFLETVLPKAKDVHLHVPVDARPYGAITAPVNADAPPIFAWDSDNARQPFSWYRWMGTRPTDFGLPPGGLVRVEAVSDLPCQWNGGASPHKGAILLLQGARDSAVAQAGLGLYPELLRGDLKPARATVEAYSLSHELQPAPGAPACGLVIRDHVPINVRLRVDTGTVVTDYTVDRWD